jgi:hypothetical protein
MENSDIEDIEEISDIEETSGSEEDSDGEKSLVDIFLDENKNNRRVYIVTATILLVLMPGNL